MKKTFLDPPVILAAVAVAVGSSVGVGGGVVGAGAVGVGACVGATVAVGLASTVGAAEMGAVVGTLVAAGSPPQATAKMTRDVRQSPRKSGLCLYRVDIFKSTPRFPRLLVAIPKRGSTSLY